MCGVVVEEVVEEVEAYGFLIRGVVFEISPSWSFFSATSFMQEYGAPDGSPLWLAWFSLACLGTGMGALSTMVYPNAFAP